MRVTHPLASLSLSVSSLALRPCRYLEASISSASNCFCGEGSGLDSLALQGCRDLASVFGEAEAEGRLPVSRVTFLPRGSYRRQAGLSFD